MTLKLNGSTSGSVSIDAPADTSPSGTDVTLTLPTSAGSSGQYLQTNGSGTLSWQTVEGLPDAIDVNASAPADSVNIDDSGRLLVNATSSQTWSGGAPLVQVSGTSASGTMHLGAFQYSNSSDGGELVLGSSRGTTVGSTTIVQNNDTLGRIRFCAADGSDLTNRGGEITCQIDGTPGSDDIPTRMMFYTASDGAGSPTERLRIQSDGILVKYGDSNSARILPQSDNAGYIGESNKRWQAIYAVNGTIQTSDEREKTEIVDSPLGTDFIKSLRPVAYKWKVGGYEHSVDEEGEDVFTPVAGQRTHYGFIAQEVRQAVGEADFGGWLLEDLSDPDSKQSLRLHEFISPMVKALQEAVAKIETLETANASLEARLTALEGGAS